MTAKRLTATSIVVAFVMIASFFVSFLPQIISPQSVQADSIQKVFTSNTIWTVPSGVTSVEVLVVAGGGGGGGNAIDNYCGGGGGAGGVIYRSVYGVTPGQKITVTVGAGGAGGSGSENNQGTNGGISVFGSLTAVGGGGGGGGFAFIGRSAGASGGSGGGGAVRLSSYSGGSSTSNQGNRGGKGYFCGILCSWDNAAGGGGGASAAGADGAYRRGGNGGDGVYYGDIFGTEVGDGGWFGGGGGGGTPHYNDNGGIGGLGGGGNGGGDRSGDSAMAFTGGGGGGGADDIGIRNGGNGGCGVVIVKYQGTEVVLVYDTPGSYTFTTPACATTVEYLVVGGGGGGGGIGGYGEGENGGSAFAGAGGGGAGGFRTGTYSVTPSQPYTIVVGTGGSAGVHTIDGGNGGDSSFSDVTAAGGGGGASSPTPYDDGLAGGSGGGGRYNSYGTGGAGNTPATIPAQGNKGGNGASSGYGAGGGGGASSAGANGITGGIGGNGGAGSANSITGISITYAGGGGGGGYGARGGAGGAGGGGSAPASRGAGNPGANGLGGGGGGATGSSAGDAFSGGEGGCGIVIIKYICTGPTPTPTSTPTATPTATSTPTATPTPTPTATPTPTPTPTPTATPIPPQPVIDMVELWTAEDSPYETDSLMPQVEFNIKVSITDGNTLNDLSTITATIYYDADGSYSLDEVPTSGNPQHCAVLTWTRGVSPAWAISSGGSTTWTIETSNCVQPDLAATNGSFEFHFKPGKVAQYTESPAKWHLFVQATDSFYNAGTGMKQNLTMAWYGEVLINNTGVHWGFVEPGLDFTDPSSRYGDISVNYISNGNYNQMVKASSPWEGSPSGSAVLNPSGNPGADEFSLKASYDTSLDTALIVSDDYQVLKNGTITAESGNVEGLNSLWLRLGMPMADATFNGKIFYQISQ